MRTSLLRSVLFVVPVIMAGLSLASLAVVKPNGVFSSSGAGSDQVRDHPEARGILVRVTWSDIEPRPGVFNFTALEGQASQVRTAGKKWSLAIIGGGLGTPDWLMDEMGASYLDYSFRAEPGYRLPLFWEEIVQERLAAMATAVAARYGDDKSLALVYVTQMTSNGIEGHLQGVNMAAMAAAGYTDERWIEAGKSAARSFAAAFLKKAIAYEVHDINGGVTVPSRIINELWAEPGLEKRVGAAMWWLSGSSTYQSDLIQVLTDFPGDIYGQVIGKSEDVERFGDDDYATVFQQAKEIGIRYLKPWEFEFKTGLISAKGAWDETFHDFNAWADDFASQTSLNAGKLGPPRGKVEGGHFNLWCLAIQGQKYTVRRSENLIDWEKVGDLSADSSDWIPLLDEGEPVEGGSVRKFFRVEPGPRP